MNQPLLTLEDRLNRVGQDFVFPPTPRLIIALPNAQPLRLRRALIWAIVLVLALNALLAVPQVRAIVRQWLKIGTVQIELSDAPLAMPTLAPSIQAIGKVMTVAELQHSLAFTLPTLPDLGEPDQGLLPPADQHIAVLVWHKPQAMLYILDDQAWASKTMYQGDVTRTKIKGQPAVWLKGDHPIFFFNPVTGAQYNEERTVKLNVLIWTDNHATYRLEMDADFDEMQRIAENMIRGF